MRAERGWARGLGRGRAKGGVGNREERGRVKTKPFPGKPTAFGVWLNLLY